MAKQQSPSGRLADALADANRPDEEVRRQVHSVPASLRFDLPEKWLALARDARLPAWRRLAAYGLLLERRLTYPVDRPTFVREVLTPLGLETAQWFDMTVGQSVPVKRGDDLVVRMVHLPIETPVGQAAVYMSLRLATDTIEQAAISPDLDRAAGHLRIP